NPRRMEAEVVRDSVLYLAGQLDVTLGGPDIDESHEEESRRRSLYFKHTPSSQVLFLKLFDAADATACYQRTQSIVPQQALALSNSHLSLVQARLLARHISQQVGENASPPEFIEAAFQTTLARPPTVEERTLSEKFLDQQVGLLRDQKQLAA